MTSTTLCMLVTACAATMLADSANSLARLQLSEFCRAAEASSSIPALTCSSVEACSSVRRDSCMLPDTISVAPPLIASELARTCFTISIKP